MKVLIGMSGGVDSSVTALLLKKRGYQVAGATLRLSSGGDTDADDAGHVAETLEMEHHVLDFSEEFDRLVVCPFISEYESGRTPNPCVTCNMNIKFPKLLDKAEELGFDMIATGHYARIGFDETLERYTLSRGVDPSKDQSYVLYGLSQDILAHTVMPLGELYKEDVRRIAAAKGFANAGKPDSQDICFIPDGDHVAFLEGVGGVVACEGDIVDTDGNVIGRHGGLHRYTIGQRKGVEVAPDCPDSQAWYVMAKDVEGNRLIVGHAGECGITDCFVTNPNWVSIPRPQDQLHVQVKTRYRQMAVPATIESVLQKGPDGVWVEIVHVVFDERLSGVAPGQSCVFYRGNLVLGGGIIAL